MIFSYFKSRREVLDWMTSVGWFINKVVDAADCPVFLLVNDDGYCLCQSLNEDDCIAFADSYVAGVVDEYNHHRDIAVLAEAALSIRSKKGE